MLEASIKGGETSSGERGWGTLPGFNREDVGQGLEFIEGRTTSYVALSGE